MPVKIIIKKTPLSNETKTLPENTPAKTAKEPGAAIKEPGTYIPFIDRISIVLDVPDNEGDAHAIYGNAFVQFKDTKVFKSAKCVWGQFKTARRVALPSVVKADKWPLLQIAYDSQKKITTKLRVEFSPVDLGPQGMVEFHSQLISLVPDGWEYFVAHGRVTMIEVTVDLSYVAVEEFHVVPQQVTTAMTWKTNGRLETLVLGKSGGNQTKIYDRGQKRKAKGQKWAGPVTTRLERRLRPQPALALSDLPGMPNPFESLQLVVPQTKPPQEEKKDYFWQMFLDSVTVRGVNSALKLLPDEKRTLYRKWLQHHAIPWWDPGVVWAKWPSILDELKIASPDSWH